MPSSRRAARPLRGSNTVRGGKVKAAAVCLS
jgi:hypothetical protein